MWIQRCGIFPELFQGRIWDVAISINQGKSKTKSSIAMMKRISVMLSLMLGVAQVLMGASNALSDGKAIAAGPDGKLVVEITIEPSIGKPLYAIT